MWIDSHCHLNALKCDDVDEALTQARGRGVEAFVCISTHFDNCAEVVGFAEAHDDVWATVGVHPLDLKSAIDSLDPIKPWLDHPKVVAIGETGLDYYYSEESAEIQRASFAQHIDLAIESQLPVVIHSRSAKADSLAMLKEGAQSGLRGVLHCFTEDWDMAQQALEWGFYISFSGIVTFKNADALREVASRVNVERMLVETDSPYLAPVPFRGKPNEPKYVVEVGEFLADWLGMDKAELAEATRRNTRTLFNRMTG